MQSPEINLSINGQLISDEGAKSIQLQKELSLQQMVLGQPDTPLQKSEVVPLTSYHIQTLNHQSPKCKT